MTGGVGGRNVVVGGRVRLGVSLLMAPALVVGVWALLLPRSFYEDFPAAGRHWVSALGPYNEHLVRNVGALNLALGALLALAAILPEQRLTQAALGAWLVYALAHFLFHATELGPSLPSTIWLTWPPLGSRCCSRWSFLPPRATGASQRRSETGGRG